ncbi:MAG TPA: phosphotransferase [Polyangia bacterium]|nr:phosphotransferase [Polyangia bacterium]
MGRIATLVLVSPAGDLLGMLPPVPLACPYWPESADVVAAVDSRFGAQVVVLRLLLAERPAQPGGAVTYLAELSSGAASVELLPIPERLRRRALCSDERRMPWAMLGGPARSLDWARAALEPTGQGSFRAVQQRSWNLSTLWRLEPASAEASTVWLKQVPHFMRQESTVLRWLNGAVPGSAPTLLAADDSGRSLLGHVAGDDLYAAPVAMRRLINEQLHVVQRAAAESVGELLGLAIPDLRGDRRAADIRQKLLTWSPGYPGLDALLRRLDEQLARLEECGLPATLVHADNHPGNARGSPRGVCLLDWGEAYIGNPVTDLLGAIGGLSDVEAAPLKAEWCASWKRLAPRSNPELALALAPFVSALHGAATYAHFVAQIEESEWPYHSQDVPRCLEAAGQLVAAG